MGSSGLPYLAQSLSAVAIAALDGVVPALGTATGEVVRHLVARYSTTPELRGLHRRTTTAVLQWVQVEGLSDAEQGLSLAARTVGRYGLTHEQIAGERFDPARVAARVLADAQGTDPDWGRRGFWRQRVQEDRHVVAERAVHETYAALIGELRASEPVVLPAVAAVLDEVGRLGLDLGAAAQDLGELRDALVRGATAGEVMAYLRTRIVDWDSPVWSGRAPSSIERRLTAHTVGNKPGTESQDFNEREALEHQTMLVVLGGPGSGKTWLARRYARTAAQESLARLEAGANLDQVEIPLFTTWDQWAQTSGPGTRETLVASSFDPALGHSDIAGQDLSGHLQRTLVLAETRVLLIVDSLDEAADRENQYSQGNRLHSLASLSSERCRVVVTSRPSAWDGVHGRVPSSHGSLRVVNLHELPTDDVEGFVEAWFASDPDRAQALVQQLRDRPDLARAAVVPLNLTFYCSIAGEGRRADVHDPETLPARRHALYTRVVRRTFHHADSSKGAGAVARDPEERMRILAAWAWHAAGNANTSTGLGNWGETFIQPPGAYDDPALDAIAPKVRVDDEGVVTRRFQHRTLLEHFVAEYVADLPTDEAAAILFPHLWYDPDWAVAAPAAIAAHNRRRPGELLGEICDDFGAYHGTTSTAWMQVSRALDLQLLAVAVESDPDEWPTRSQDILDACRMRSLVSRPGFYAVPLLEDSVHWNRSSADIASALLTEFPRIGPSGVELLGVLMERNGEERMRSWALDAALEALADPHIEWPQVWLDVVLASRPSDDVRARARSAVLETLATPDVSWVDGRVRTLLSLGPSDEERARARAAVLGLVLAAADSNSYGVDHLLMTLSSLGPTDRERAKAWNVAIAALPDVDYFQAANLVKALLELGPSDEAVGRARAAVIGALDRPHVEADEWVGLLLSLAPSDEDRARAQAVLLGALPGVYRSSADSLARALVLLGAGAAARAAVLSELADTGPYFLAERVDVLMLFEPGAEERARARAAVGAVLFASPEPSLAILDQLVTPYLSLGPDIEERARVRRAVLSAMARQRERMTVNVAIALQSMGPLDAELTQARARARATVLSDLADTDPVLVARSVAALLALEPSEEERAHARSSVLSALTDTDAAWRIDDMVAALLSLGPSEEERAQARTSVLSALTDTDATWLDGLLTTLVSLGPSSAERAVAWRIVLDASTGDSRYWFEKLVEILEPLQPGDSHRARARAQAVAALSNGTEDNAVTLAAGLRKIYALPAWLDLISDVPAAETPTT
ncbi:NACHT domain-containing protein [Promicromonospora vindobonensis]|uniref:NACHT domain-containing protein n=1 Tax=Promicromonospora vindobonensis TaxID=195748 RepID=A0ABW5VY55_9MICO